MRRTRAWSSTQFFPAADPHTVSVAATTVADQRFSWSNFGSWVRLAAPGYYLYVEPTSASAEPGGVPPPPTGFGMAAHDVEELSGLVNSKTAVTITD